MIILKIEVAMTGAPLYQLVMDDLHRLVMDVNGKGELHIMGQGAYLDLLQGGVTIRVEKM